MQRGKIVIVLIVGVAVAMAGYTCWHHYRKGYHALRFWGQQAATLIRHAPQVELLKLAGDRQSDDEVFIGKAAPQSVLRIGDQDVPVLQRDDISSMRGLVHARHTLIVDRNFNWQQSAIDPATDWDFALRFSDQQQQVTLVFSLQQRTVRSLDHDRQLKMNEAIDRIAEFFEPQLDLQADKPSS